MSQREAARGSVGTGAKLGSQLGRSDGDESS